MSVKNFGLIIALKFKKNAESFYSKPISFGYA